MPKMTKFAAAPAVLAALAMPAAPASAASNLLPATPPAYSQPTAVDDILTGQTAEHHRHRRYHRYRYRRGPGLGDVIAGVLIVGAIAHVATKANRNREDRRYRDRDYRRDASWDDGRGIDRAVRMCVDEVEREQRVETVDRVDRTALGWQVEGTIYSGAGFSCTIGEDGRVRDIDIGRSDARSQGGEYEEIQYRGREDADEQVRPEVDDRQWDDDRYSAEWSRVDRDGQTAAASPQAEYPGGPVEGDEAIDGDLEIGEGYQGAGN